jgi:ubiquinone/menaquinone biosynthesis C-methylase UbiE
MSFEAAQIRPASCRISPAEGESELEAYQRVFASELQTTMGALPLGPGSHVIDVACGKGYYSHLLAERVAPEGMVVAVDASPAKLASAARSEERRAVPIEWCQADAHSLPFSDNTFHLAWCAHSLCSFADVILASREMIRVVRPGAFVSVLENDSMHHVLLPWPVEMEMKIQAALRQAYAAEFSQPDRCYVARWLPDMLHTLGLTHVEVQPWIKTRQAPWDGGSQQYLLLYLDNLRCRIAPYLSDQHLDQYDQFRDPANPRCLLFRAGSCMVLVDWIISGVKASPER